jgi:putative phosphoesterase
MLLGVISDTHGHMRNTLEAIRRLESFPLDVVIHCGDIGSAAIPGLFVRWPAHFVLGNVDGHSEELEQAIRAAGHSCHGRFGQLILDGSRIAFLHGDDTRLLKETINCGNFDLVCHGHTHQALEMRNGPTPLVLNPGAVYRANPHSVAVVRLPELEVEYAEF